MPEKTTSPWSQSSWVPDRLKTPTQHNGWRLKFVRRDNIQRHIDLGFIMANKSDWGYAETGLDCNVDSKIRVGDLIGMEIKEAMAKERQAFFSNLTDQRSLTAADIARDAASNIEGEEADLKLTVTHKEKKAKK